MANLQNINLDVQYPWYAEKIRHLETVYIRDVSNLPAEANAEKDEFLRESLQSLLDIPLIQNGSLLGFYGFVSIRGSRILDAEFVALAKILGEIFANSFERRGIEEELRRSEARLAEAQRVARIGSWEWDIINDTVETTDEVFRVLGLEHGETISMPWGPLEVVHPDDKPRVTRVLERALEKQESFAMDHRVLRDDGSERVIHARAELIRDESGGACHMIGTVQDITERKHAEALAKKQQEQLFQASKMISLGTLISGFAHEVNNPNNYIRLNAQGLMDFWNDIEKVLESAIEDSEDLVLQRIPFPSAKGMIREMLNGIVEGSKRIEGLIEDLKAYVREGKGELLESVDINNVVESGSKIIRSLINKSTINFSFIAAENLPKVEGNSHQLEQVIINLLTNACQSLENKDKSIAISTEKDELSEWITIVIEDEGIGIDKEHISRITDPLFTTRRDKGGTGLGLSVSHQIIREHGGELIFDSEPGRGTVASVRLPLSTENGSRHEER